ncbi:cation-translocating P-type ATPase [Aquabacterium sp.]|uniref:cation-translocating P-type ATPase n=1 Tax=Aquabacterium sp. TaxID=1872578 RepID=UPI002E36A84B|nr:cation-translocating P-type ATPase [Aquabacterium sp.]HEX5311010.1 cation-translocating P-type ATPase [Aquabacterium sp.]
MTDPLHQTGLTEAEAARRLREHGPNELQRPESRSLWGLLKDTLSEPMFQLLIGAGLIYVALGDLGEAAMLLAFVLITVAISLVQASRTERVLEALRDLSSPRALVIRDGAAKRIAGREVVEGDILLISEGDRVPADAHLIEAHDLQTDESLLTGESVPVRKVDGVRPAVNAQAIAPGGDDLPWVFAGTLVVRGRGTAEVIATGPRSQMGRIGAALAQVDPAVTRLQQQTRAWVRGFAIAGVVLSLAVTALYGWQRGGWLDAVLAGITLAMSLLPQEFPLIMSVFMAMGAWRMAQHRVLVRRSTAIEALGTATVLCTDKTGTLTQNNMTLAHMVVAQGQWQRGQASLPEAFHPLLECGLLACQRDPFDPMEKAFWDAASHHLVGPEQVHLHPDWELARAYPLRPELLAMSHVWHEPGGVRHVIAAKGAPEAVMDLCHLSDADCAPWRTQVEALAAQGMRVLAVARSQGAVEHGPGEAWPDVQHDFDFEFLGLVGLVDPLRETVPDAVRTCREAGIRVAMITGDYPVTALAIAQQAGIDTRGGVLRGDELHTLDEAALQQRVREVCVFARVMPDQKLRIVRALQAQGEVVAMTGDGVNDAPSLKAADIGVAMGGRGTDVAREASAIVLLDDDFQSIARAVAQGRRIDDNLRKAMAFVLAVHVPIAGLSILPLLMGWPLLFSPVHIAFLELIIDPVCSIVFEAEAAEPRVMQRRPHKPGTPLLSRGLLMGSVAQGVLILTVVACFYAALLATQATEAEARTASFVALVACNIGLILGNRSQGSNMLATVLRPNRAFWVMLAATSTLLAVVLHWAPATELFRFVPLPAATLGACLAMGLGVWVALELGKWGANRVRRSAQSD